MGVGDGKTTPAGAGVPEENAALYIKQSTEMMQQMALSMSVGNALQGVRSFDGTNMLVRDFIQDIKNGEANIADNAKAKKQYVSAVLAKLRGQARECTSGKQITTLQELIRILKKRFTPGRDYAYYADKISTLRMKQGESVGAFYDQLNTLMNAAQSVLKEGDPGAAEDLTAEQAALMVKPLQQTALGTFIRGLPTDIAKAIVIKGCTTLERAYEEAVRYECKMDAKLIPDTRYRSKFDNPYAWGEPEARQAERWMPRQPRYDGQNQGRGYDRYNGDSRYVGQIHTDEGEHGDRGYDYPEYPIEDHGEYPDYLEQDNIAVGPYVGQIQRENYELRRDTKDWQRPNVQETQFSGKPGHGMPYQGAAANGGGPYQGPRPPISPPT